MFESLVVLHCELDSKKKLSGIFQNIEERIFCFRPVTCTRQVFIFDSLSEAEKEIFDKNCATLATIGQHYELYTGFDAFEFLLKWAVGLLNPRYNYNDRFVLGKCRELWTSFCESKGTVLKDRSMAKLIPMLLEDASLIRSTIENRMEEEKISASARIKIMTDMCHARRVRRERQETLGALRFFDSYWNEEAVKATKEEMGKSIDVLGKKIQNLQKRGEIKEETVTLTCGSKEARARLTITQSAIVSCWIKRQLEHANHAIEDSEQSQFSSLA